MFEGQESHNPKCIDPVAKWCVEHTEKDDIFIDVGAHIGRSAIPTMIEKKPIYTILIEAHDDSAKKLRKNVERYVEGNNWEIIEELLLDTVGMRNFTCPVDSPIQSSIFDRFSVNNEEVITKKIKSTTLDEILKGHEELKENKIVVKLDIELSEYLAWQGMKENLHRIKAMCMEFMPSILVDAGVIAMNFTEKINKAGFEILNLDGTNITHQELYSPEGSKVDIYLRNTLWK